MIKRLGGTYSQTIKFYVSESVFVCICVSVCVSACVRANKFHIMLLNIDDDYLSMMDIGPASFY